MNKKQVSTIILALYAVLFGLVTLVNFVRSEDYWVDGLTAVVGCLIFILLHYKYPVHPTIAALEGFIFIPNQLGFLFLYEMVSLNYHGDWIIHFIGTGIAAIVFMYHIRKINCIKDRIIITTVISFALTMTGGTILELAEYWGFIFFGLGNSYLGFGVGDNSQNFGPWENASLDMTFNLIGAFVGLALYYVYILLQSKHKKM